jgi:hypothetical protein
MSIWRPSLPVPARRQAPPSSLHSPPPLSPPPPAKVNVLQVVKLAARPLQLRGGLEALVKHDAQLAGLEAHDAHAQVGAEEGQLLAILADLWNGR